MHSHELLFERNVSVRKYVRAIVVGALVLQRELQLLTDVPVIQCKPTVEAILDAVKPFP